MKTFCFRDDCDSILYGLALVSEVQMKGLETPEIPVKFPPFENTPVAVMSTTV